MKQHKMKLEKKVLNDLILMWGENYVISNEHDPRLSEGEILDTIKKLQSRH